MRKKIDSYLIISNGEEEKDKGVSCVRMGITNYSINEKRSVLVMDAAKFIKERKRMCKSFGERCKGCPGFDAYEEALCLVDRESTLDATAQVAIVEEWSAAHPRKTRQDVFLEQWPNAKCVGDILTICPKVIDMSFSCSAYSNVDIGCPDCRHRFWMQEVE